MAKISDAAELDATQVETLKQKLLDLRASLGTRHAGELRSRNDEVEDEGDTAARTNDEDTLRALAEADHTRLAEIERALGKIEAGSYGLDEESEEPIGYARLSVLPWARYGAETQEKLEKLEKRS